MNRFEYALLIAAAIGLLVPYSSSRLLAQQAPPQQPPPDYSEDIEVLTRGPIHEAFAVPVGVDPMPGVVVPRQPPADIEEVPPDMTLADPGAVWIRGYWQWDDQREDFIWVSAVLRVPPPGNAWVPGYWAENKEEGGYQRISGFWAPIEQQQVTYLPPPPESLEAGPSSPQPSADHFWVPGCWVYGSSGYAWRGGYWSRMISGWTWTPAHYLWTPYGYVYSAGYWDYPPQRRAVLFAPIWFRTAIYARPGFYYRPWAVLSIDSLMFHLFVRPSYCSYYFGDYYGAFYGRSGFYPWFTPGANAWFGVGGHARWYDPIYTYQRWHHGRSDPGWTARLRADFDHRLANEDARPPKTFAEQRTRFEANGRGDARGFALATSVSEAMADRSFADRVRRLGDTDRQAIRVGAESAARIADQRRRFETEARADAGASATAPAPRSFQLPDIRPGSAPTRLSGQPGVPSVRRETTQPGASSTLTPRSLPQVTPRGPTVTPRGPSVEPRSLPQVTPSQPRGPSVTPRSLPQVTPSQPRGPSVTPRSLPQVTPSQPRGPSFTPRSLPQVTPSQPRGPSVEPRSLPQVTPSQPRGPSFTPRSLPQVTPSQPRGPSFTPRSLPQVTPSQPRGPSFTPRSLPQVTPSQPRGPSISPPGGSPRFSPPSGSSSRGSFDRSGGDRGGRGGRGKP